MVTESNQTTLRITQHGGSGLGEKIVTVNGRRDPNLPSLWIVLDTYYFAFARNLDGCGSGQLGRKRHGELDVGVLLNFTVDVEKHSTRAHIASLCMNRSVGTGKPQPNRHFQRKSGEYALLFQGQGPVPEIFAFRS